MRRVPNNETIPDPWVIEEIRRRKEAERRKEDDRAHQQIRIDIDPKTPSTPLPGYEIITPNGEEPPPENAPDPYKPKRGVVIIE